MAYRILLFGGPSDGDTLVAVNPWFECNIGGHLYRADLLPDGQPVAEPFDVDTVVLIEVVTPGGDVYTPPLQTIKMYYQGRADQ